MKNEEKWPTKFEVVKICDSILGDILSIYLIVCVVNDLQMDTASKVINFLISLPIVNGQKVGVSIVTQTKLEQIRDAFTPRSKRWRGQYQSLSKAVVSACEKAINS